MSALQRSVLGIGPDVAFARLSAVLGRGHEHGGLRPGQQVVLPPAGLSPCRVAVADPPHLLVLETGGEVAHRIVLTTVTDGTTIMWDSPRAEDDAGLEAIVALLDLALLDRNGAAAPRHLSATGPTSVLDHVALDHTALRSQLDRLCEREGPLDRREVTALLAAVARHEAAESVLLRPLLRQTDGGAAVAPLLDRQERRVAEDIHALLAGTVEAAPDAAGLVRRLRSSLLANCCAEEDAAHPRLRAGVASSTLVDLGERYVAMTRAGVRPRDHGVRRRAS